MSVQALLMLGLFTLMLAFVAEFGSLRARSLRLHAAFDRAALAATGAIDAQALADSGQLALDSAAAEDVARKYLAQNLAPFERSLSGQTAEQVAAAARVGIVAAPAPAVTVSGAVDLPTGLLALTGAGPTITYRIESTSELKGP